MTGGLILRQDGAEGWLGPYLSGLRAGLAIAGCCPCGRVSLPPETRCGVCHGPVTAMVTLPGAATLIHRSTGADGDVALVQFDGATTASVAVLRGVEDQTRGMIAPAPAGRPHLILTPVAP